jgi:sec-independent protein translocase protein TatA
VLGYAPEFFERKRFPNFSELNKRSQPMLEYKVANFGIWELLLILAIVIVLFGAGKLPQLGSALGQSIRNFKKGFEGESQEISGPARRVDRGSSPESLCLLPKNADDTKQH